MKTIFVTGSTGHQGFAVANLLLNNGFHVKALVRNPTTIKARQLENAGAELVKGDLNDVSSFSDALDEADGLFCLLTYTHGVSREISQGKFLIEACVQSKVKHFIYSSVIGADLKTGIPHWESKNIIENFLRDSGINHTIIRPVSLMENFLIPQVKKGIANGKLTLPLQEKTIQQYICCDDIAALCLAIFKNPGKYDQKVITLAADEMSMREAADIFSEVMQKKIIYKPLPGIITRIFMGKNLHRMFRWVDYHNAIFVRDIDSLRNELPGMKTLKDWIRTRKEFQPESADSRQV